ncbi:MAG: ATP-binding protein [Verrucomicrobiota bacterium]
MLTTSTTIEQTVERLRQSAERVQRERRDFMASQPQVVRCRVHPDCERMIDERITATATANNFGKFKAGYTPCPKCVEEAQLVRLIGYGLPENLIHATFENFIPDDDADAEHVEAVKSFCQVKRGSLIMLGGYGTGKSHLAAASLHTFGKGWFVKNSTLLNCLRDTYRDKSAFDPIDRAQSARLFVLDDAGLSVGGRDQLPLLHEILDYRHGERLPTIITSNLEWDSLANVIGERMADRLCESAFGVMKFTGGSHRREARQRYFDDE